MPNINNPEWIKDSHDQYMTTKRPLPKSNQERDYVFDKDHRCDPSDEQDLHDQPSLTSKDQPNASSGDQHYTAHIEQPPKEGTNSSNRKPIFPEDFPASLNSI